MSPGRLSASATAGRGRWGRDLEEERLRRRLLQNDLRVNIAVLVDVHELAGLELPPSLVFVHALARNDHRRRDREIGRANADTAGRTGPLEVAAPMGSRQKVH
jgi:hypothetical protein